MIIVLFVKNWRYVMFLWTIAFQVVLITNIHEKVTPSPALVKKLKSKDLGCILIDVPRLERQVGEAVTV